MIGNIVLQLGGLIECVGGKLAVKATLLGHVMLGRFIALDVGSSHFIFYFLFQ